MNRWTTLASLALAFLLAVTLPGVSLGADPTAPKTVPVKAPLAVPAKNQAVTPVKPKIPRDVLKIRRAQITDLVIGTDATGTWTWTATVKNTGTATLKGSDLTVQGYRLSFPPAQNSWQAASGSIVSQGTIAPKQSVQVTRRWSRCCLTTQLKVDLRDGVSNAVWGTKTLSNLIYSTAPMKPFDVRVKAIVWDQAAKTWKATVKNNTGFTLKVTVQADLLPAGFGTPVPAGGQQLTLGPMAQKITMPLHAMTAQNGDLLRVHLGFDMGSGAGTCNENWEDCGGKGSNNITVPNSKDF